MNKKIILGSLVALIAIVASFFIYNQSSQSSCCDAKTTASAENTPCECGDACVGESCDCSDACQSTASVKDDCCASENSAMTSSVESSGSCENTSCNETCTCGDSCSGTECDCPCGACK